MACGAAPAWPTSRPPPAAAASSTGDGPGSAYLLAFSDFQVEIYRNGVLRATVPPRGRRRSWRRSPGRSATQSLLVTHPDVPPQRLTRESDTVWTIAPVAVRRDRLACSHQRAVRPLRCRRRRDAVERHHRDGHAEHFRAGVRRRAPRRHRADEGQADSADQHSDQHPGRRPGAAGTSTIPARPRIGTSWRSATPAAGRSRSRSIRIAW